jgi:hypothetical protein
MIFYGEFSPFFKHRKGPSIVIIFLISQHGCQLLAMIFQEQNFILLVGYFLPCYMQYTAYLNNKGIYHEATYSN